MRKDKVIVRVENTGTGVALGDAERWFRPFELNGRWKPIRCWGKVWAWDCRSRGTCSKRIRSLHSVCVSLPRIRHGHRDCFSQVMRNVSDRSSDQSLIIDDHADDERAKLRPGNRTLS